jgi:hypothetical protein
MHHAGLAFVVFVGDLDGQLGRAEVGQFEEFESLKSGLRLAGHGVG